MHSSQHYKEKGNNSITEYLKIFEFKKITQFIFTICKSVDGNFSFCRYCKCFFYKTNLNYKYIFKKNNLIYVWKMIKSCIKVSFFSTLINFGGRTKNDKTWYLILSSRCSWVIGLAVGSGCGTGSAVVTTTGGSFSITGWTAGAMLAEGLCIIRCIASNLAWISGVWFCISACRTT